MFPTSLNMADSNAPSTGRFYAPHDTLPRKGSVQVKRVRSVLMENGIDRYVGANRTLSSEERVRVAELSSLISILSTEDIRVLAVHAGLEQTIEAIEYNSSYWARDSRRLCGMLLHDSISQDIAIAKVSGIVRELERKSGVAREAHLRIPNNHTIYEKARKTLLRFKPQDNPIRAAALKICPRADIIWANAGVMEWQRCVDEISLLTCYCEGLNAKANILRRTVGQPIRKESEKLKVGNEARTRLEAMGHYLSSYEAIALEDHEVSRHLSLAIDACTGRFPKRRFPEHWD